MLTGSMFPELCSWTVYREHYVMSRVAKGPNFLWKLNVNLSLVEYKNNGNFRRMHTP